VHTWVHKKQELIFTAMSPFTAILETHEPFGSEVQPMRVEANDAREAASRALHNWQNGMDFCPITDVIEDLEDGAAAVPAVLDEHGAPLLRRTPSGSLA
jgi:hypothetical protein